MSSTPSPISDFVGPSKVPDNRSRRVPIGNSQARSSAPHLESKGRPRKRSIKQRYIVVGAGILLLVLLGGLYIYRTVVDRPILDPAITSRADFPVYAPSALPSGYNVKDDSTSINKGVLVYTIESEKADPAITITVQPWPTGFDMSKLVEGGSVSGTAVNVGTLYNLSTENSTKYLLNMGSTLIFLTSPQKVDTGIIHALVNSLEKVT